MRKFLVSLFIVISLSGIIAMFSNKTFADYDYSGALDSVGDWESNGSEIVEKTDNFAGAIITSIQVVGTGVAIIILIYMGVRYMIKSPSEKAEFKKSMTAYVVGAIIIFTASTLVGIIYDFSTTNLDTTATPPKTTTQKTTTQWEDIRSLINEKFNR